MVQLVFILNNLYLLNKQKHNFFNYCYTLSNQNSFKIKFSNNRQYLMYNI